MLTLDKPDLILASLSPRRQELLSLTGLSFEVIAPQVDEHTSLGAREAVQELCRRKAMHVMSLHPGNIILAADTLVAMEDVPFGKPADEEDAFRMLSLLQGQTHQVHTGVCVADRNGTLHTGVDTSDVTFLPMTPSEIRAYIATGEPMDKAGAYALQGKAGMFIREVVGTPSGVIGLPLPLTCRLLRECGLPILTSSD